MIGYARSALHPGEEDELGAESVAERENSALRTVSVFCAWTSRKRHFLVMGLGVVFGENISFQPAPTARSGSNSREPQTRLDL